MQANFFLNHIHVTICSSFEVKLYCLLLFVQTSALLDDLLELLCTDIVAEDVESAEKALNLLTEKVNTISKFVL